MKTNLNDINQIKALQTNLRILETPQGKEVMKFLEEICGWYQSVYDPTDRDKCLINDGKRQVLATLKTLLEQPADTIFQLARERWL